MKTLKPALFNPNGDDSVNARKIWYGDSTNLIQLNDVKFTWATQMYNQMRDQFWIPAKIDLTSDVVDYKNLISDERDAYNGILSYLTFLDSIQVCNLGNVKAAMTAPEVLMCVGVQSFFEQIHNESYQTIIETIIPSNERAAIYTYWKTDKILLDRCRFIAKLYQDYLNRGTEEAYFVSLIANYMLEGVYFYTGFCVFYNFVTRQLMPGTGDIIKLINRDELSHVRLFQKLIVEAMNVFPNSKDQVYELFNQAADQEILWTNHIVDNKILGMSSESNTDYIKYLVNIRLKAIGLDHLYPGVKNPYTHLERIADTTGEGSTKSNFFESSVTSYNLSSVLNDWDDI